MNNSNESIEQPKKLFSVGGEALIEGIMMRSPTGYSVVVRDTSGKLIIENTAQQPLTKRFSILGLPIVRGAAGLFDSMSIGIKALFHSAEISGLEDDPDYKPSKFDKFIEDKFGDKAFNIIMTIAMIFAVCFSILLFVVLPNFVSGVITNFFKLNTVFYNAIEGILRIAIFMVYIILVSKSKDINRVFMYHGAEHKTIFCYEHREELIVENVRKQSRFHPRCGTAFLFVFMIISFLIFSFIPKFDNFLINAGLRVVLIPLVVGVAFEFNRYAGRSESIVARILRAPGLGLQRFTTKEPDDKMIEVAITALNESLNIKG